jgi:hypothetical protein
VIDGGDLSPIAEDEKIFTKRSVTKRKNNKIIQSNEESNTGDV